MLALIVVLILVGAQNSGAENEKYNDIEPKENRFIFNAVIKHLLELFRDVIKNGDFKKDIPVLDPYEMDNAALEVAGKFLSLSANFTNGVISGVGDFRLGSLEFQKKNLLIDLELTFPLISYLTEYYALDGKIFDVFSTAGCGLMQISVYNTVINGKIYLKQSYDGKSILLSHFENVNFSIEKITSESQFDGNIDEIINAMAQDLLANYLTRFSKAICTAYGDVAMQALNTLLNKFESWQIIAVIL